MYKSAIENSEIVKHITELSKTIGVLQSVGENIPQMKPLTESRIEGCNGVIKYLTELIPHVITFKEAIQFEGEVWCEHRNGCIGWCDLVYDGNGELAVYTTHGIYCVSPNMYGISWRVWSSVPTKEMREGMGWKD